MILKLFRASLSAAAIGLCLSVAGVTPAAAQAPAPLKIGILRIASPLFVGAEKKFFEAEGVPVEIVFFRNGSELVPSLSRGQIDVAATAAGAALYNSMASGVKTKIVADYFSLLPNTRSHGILVRQALIDSGKVKTASDLKGLSVAITATGQYTHYAAAHTLAKVGLAESDVRFVTMSYPDMTAALASGAVDAASSVEPFITLTAKNKSAHLLVRDSETMPNLEVAVLMFGERLSGPDRATGVKFLRGYVKAIRYMHEALKDQAKGKDVAAIMQKHLPLKDPALYEHMGWPMARPDASVNRASLQEQLDWYVKRGLVREKPNLDAFIDTSLVTDAAK